MLRKHWANLLGSLFLLGLAAALLAWLRAPKAELIPPQSGALLPQEAVQVRFSAPMQAETVRARLALSPAYAADLLWPDARTLRIQPREAWRPGDTLELTLEAGASARDWPRLKTRRAYVWRVAVSTPSLLYLWPARGAPPNLYRLRLEDGSSEQLTDEPFGVSGYAVSRDGLSLYYAAAQGDIYRLERAGGERTLLVDCGQDVCSAPALSPDGAYLAWERTPVTGRPQEALPQVWYLPLTDGAVPAPIPAPDSYSRQPRWSAGGWLAVYLPNRAAFFAWNPAERRSVTWPNQTGEGGTWLPADETFVTPEITLVPNGYLTEGGDFLDLPTSHLLAYPLDGAPPEDLSRELAVEDADPAASPDGALLAFARKYLDPRQWTPGRQVWLLELGSRTARPLTSAPLYNHTAFAWSPDGRSLAYVRSNQDDFSQPPELWMTALDGSAAPLRLVINAYAPQWIP